MASVRLWVVVSVRADSEMLEGPTYPGGEPGTALLICPGIAATFQALHGAHVTEFETA